MHRRNFLKSGVLAAAVAGTTATLNAANPVSPATGLSRHRLQNWRKVKSIYPRVPEDIWDSNPSAPHVIQVGNKLRMYYEGRYPMLMPDGRTEFQLQIGAAEADVADPLSWKKVSAKPILTTGDAGAIDSHWTGYPWVVKISDAHWHMYYVGWGGKYRPDAPIRKIWRTTLAESDDQGVTWRKTGHAVLPIGRPGGPDEHGTGSCSVCKVGDEYWMWYTAIFQPRADFYRISTALAVSRDGGHTFEPHATGAVLNIPPVIGMGGSTCSKPFVRFHEGKFQMWFSCAKDGRHYRVHYAESDDGMAFRWDPDPVIEVSPSGWDSEMTCYPSVITVAGRTLMYYVGNQYTGIGMAELISRAPG